MFIPRFSDASDNAKLRKLEIVSGMKGFTFSVRSGHNCPMASDCKSKAVKNKSGTKRIVDGPNTLFRCFSATQEVLFPDLYDQREYNEQLIEIAARSWAEAGNLIADYLPPYAGWCRIHVGGDFRTLNYFKAWLHAAELRPRTIFYGYTKMIPFLVKFEGHMPPNFRITASRGGKRDDLIDTYKLREAVVVYSIEQAERLGLEIDHDDSHALYAKGSFALLIHGVQPKGSEAAEALKKLKKAKAVA